MTTPISNGSTNTFTVKDLNAFINALSPFVGCDIHVVDADLKQVFLTSDDCFELYREDADDPEDLSEIISPHIKDDEVVTFKWVSVQGYSILGGVIAINSQNETYSQTLDGLVAVGQSTLGEVVEDSPLGMIGQMT